MTNWRGTDATKSPKEECAPKSSVVRTKLEGVVHVVRAGDQKEAPLRYLTAVAVAVGEGMTLPPLISHP